MTAKKKDLPAETPIKLTAAARVRAAVLALKTRLLAHRRTRAALGITGVIAMLFCSTLLLNKAREAVTKPRTQLAGDYVSLAGALAALDAGYYSEAQRLARTLSTNALLPEDAATPEYILGAATARQAAAAPEEDRRAMYTRAARHLSSAVRRGVKANRKADAHWLLGSSLYFSGNADESRRYFHLALTEASAKPGVRPTRVYRMLASAYSSGKQPDFPRSLEFLAAYLADPQLPPGDRNYAHLEQARIFLKTGDRQAAEQAVVKIPASDVIYPDSCIVRGRLALAKAAEMKQALGAKPTPDDRAAFQRKCDEAIEILRQAQADPLRTDAVRLSMYLVGVVLREKGDTAAALVQYQRTRTLYLETDEGIAAALDEADLLRAAGQDDQAILAYTMALESLGTQTQPRNHWIGRSEFRDRAVAAYRHYLSSGQYERAIAIAEHLGALVAPGRGAELAAEAAVAKADQMLAEAEHLPLEKAGKLRGEGRRLMRSAGRRFMEVARIEFSSRVYPEHVWRAGQCLLTGHDFIGAVAAFELHQKYELRHRPAALAYMGEALISLDRLDEALVALRECIELYPTDAASFRARILASQAYLDKGEAPKAESLLLENLNGESLTPESKEWRESLFALGKLLFASGRYDQAISRLREAVERYGTTHESVEARYTVAEAYRLAAKAPQEKFETATIEAARLAYFKQVQTSLTSAISYYEQVQKVLNQSEPRIEPTPHETAMLRNSYFAVGAALFQLGRYEDAIRAYSTAISRYQHDPEVLDAFVQIASCYRRLNKLVEARGTFQQAKVVLSRIPAKAPFTSTTNYTRDEWTRVLDWLIKL